MRLCALSLVLPLALAAGLTLAETTFAETNPPGSARGITSEVKRPGSLDSRADAKQAPVQAGEVATDAATRAAEAIDAWSAGYLAELKKHSFFKKLAFHPPVESTGSFALFAQRRIVDSDLAGACRRHYGSWLREISDVFERDYRVPAALVRLVGRPRTPIVLLATEGDYVNYWPSRRGRPGAYVTYGIYDLAIAAPVHAQCVRATKANGYWRRYPLLRDAVRGMLRDHAAAGLTEIAELWIEDGLASYLSFHLASVTQDLSRHHVERTFIDLLCPHGLVRDDWISTRELLAVRGRGGLNALQGSGSAQAKKTGVDPKHLQFEAQAWLLAHYLHQAEEDRYRTLFPAYLGQALRGEGSVMAFCSAFGIDDLDPIDKSLRTYATTLFHGRPGAIPIEDGAHDAAAATDAAAMELEHALPSLDIRPHNASEFLAHALWTAKTGELTRAIAIAEAGIAEAKSETRVAPRLEDTLTRLRAVRDARDEALQDVVTAEGKLRIEASGKNLNLPLSSYREGLLHFDSNRAGIESLPVDGLMLGELMTALSQPLKARGKRWTLGFALAMEGDKKASRYLSDDSEHSKAVERELSADLGEIVFAGKAFGLLESIEALGRPGSEEAAATLVSTLERLMADHKHSPVTSRRTAALRTWAAISLRKLFAGAGVIDSLRGQVKVLEDSQIEITYSFDDEFEDADWLDDPDYLIKDHRFYARQFGYQGRPTTRRWASEGSLQVSGWVCLRHVLEFQQPISVEVDLQYTFPKTGESAGSTQQIGIFDDGAEHYACAVNPGADLLLNDGQGFQIRDLSDPERIDPTINMHLGIHHDGKSLWTTAEGKEVKRATSGALKSGGVFLWVNSESLIHYHEIKISGRPTDASMARMAEDWVDERLTAIGFD
ncbi:MAG: hypothetical protein ACI835_001878 [Planctomycetota bacterium]|jgi:hypothetical protein